MSETIKKYILLIAGICVVIILSLSFSYASGKLLRKKLLHGQSIPPMQIVSDSYCQLDHVEKLGFEEGQSKQLTAAFRQVCDEQSS